MKQPKVKVLLREDKPLADNSFPVWIRITHLRKSSYISTGYSCLLEEWDTETSRLFEMKPRITAREKEALKPEEIRKLKEDYSIIRINPLAKKINAEIDKSVREILDTKDKLKALEQSLNPKHIKKQITAVNVDYSDKSFIKYYDKQISILEANEAFGTAKTYKSILKALKEDYLKGKDLAFDEINVDLLEDYKAFLTREGYVKKTIHNHLKTFRSILYKAIKEPNKKYFGQANNPFFAFKLEADNRTKKERLTIDEIRALKELKLEQGTRLFDTRNIFLFSYYNAGIRIGDLLQLRWENITGEGRLEYVMDKTGKQKSLKLLPQALEILQYYKTETTKPKDFLFPFLNNYINKQNKAYFKKQLEAKSALVNKCLKELAKKAEIKKNVSTHIARHSFSDMARKKGVSIFDISKLLGHSDVKVTRQYLESLDLESQDKTHESVFEGL